MESGNLYGVPPAISMVEKMLTFLLKSQSRAFPLKLSCFKKRLFQVVSAIVIIFLVRSMSMFTKLVVDRFMKKYYVLDTRVATEYEKSLFDYSRLASRTSAPNILAFSGGGGCRAHI